MGIKERIVQFIDLKGISINAFEKSIGASKSYIKNTKNISADVVSNILLIYSDLSAEWLFRGIGKMEKQFSEIVPEGNINNEDMDETSRIAMRSMAETIKRLESENAELRRKLGIEERPSA